MIVENKPTYDFYIIPKQFKVEDTLEFLTAFSLTEEELNIKINKAKRYSIHRPSIFYREMECEWNPSGGYNLLPLIGTLRVVTVKVWNPSGGYSASVLV